jgi:hypothetical protein
MIRTSGRKNREHMRRYVERRRAERPRPLQHSVYDKTAPGFAEEIRRECEAVRRSPEEAEVLDFIEQVADWPDD